MHEIKGKEKEFLLEAAKYFENRPTNGEDKAYWSNVYNAENCRKIAAEFERLQTELTSVGKSLEASVKPEIDKLAKAVSK